MRKITRMYTDNENHCAYTKNFVWTYRVSVAPIGTRALAMAARSFGRCCRPQEDATCLATSIDESWTVRNAVNDSLVEITRRLRDRVVFVIVVSLSTSSSLIFRTTIRTSVVFGVAMYYRCTISSLCFASSTIVSRTARRSLLSKSFSRLTRVSTM